MKKELILQWLQKAIEELKIGEEILFPVKSKTEQKERKKAFMKELEIICNFDTLANQLQIDSLFNDHRLWVVIKKIPFSSSIAFKKKEDGTVERLSIADNAEKLRRILLMKEDGLSLKEIEKLEGKLSFEELEYTK